MKFYFIRHILLLWSQYKLKKDAQKLTAMTFDDLPSEDDWLAVQSKLN